MSYVDPESDYIMEEPPDFLDLLLAHERERIRPAVTIPSFTCPRPECGRTSFNPNDVREGYCGNCHDWTGPGA